MQIKLNTFIPNIKCLWAVVIIFVVLYFLGYNLFSFLIAYIVIGLPFIFMLDMLISKFLLNKQFYIIVENTKVTIHQSSRLEEVDEDIFDLSTAKITYRYIPCFEAITFDNTHSRTLFKFLFYSNKEYQALVDLIKKHGESNT